ncbi:hypothetical protein [Cellulomonas marina]|uniref:Uncharacterized protein n=1 Tax=Cellulomonas marina TaxID=988821 RepID=A0A1I0W5D4_9CELL|nr:hypothetical protein [Cellulomonas marina]GIG29970.1 hypothetical protein Cma02nite_25700 [Cellulomonas marina]SFA83253.1 hypothetical protein SAMN05421867_102153 [Cellulomonas marina]
MTRPQPPADFAPPRLADLRRWGALVGLVGAVVFVWSYGPGLAGPLPVLARVLVVVLVVAAVVLLLVVPRWLGRFHVPTPLAMSVYVGCVAAELVLIRLGSAWLDGRGDASARPALIAAVVGLHFLPFAWAFRERMFTVLGAALVLLGGGGLVAELSGVGHAAALAAVASGLVMAALVAAYAAGAFASPRPVSSDATSGATSSGTP